MSSTPTPTRDPNPAVVDAPSEEGPVIQLPEIKKFELPNPSGKKDKNDHNPVNNIDHTVSYLQSRAVSFSYTFGRSTNCCRRVI
jgi:hypothetical protein